MNAVLPRLSIRAWLLLMVVAVALPSAALWTWRLQGDAHDAQARAYADVGRIAENLAVRLTQVLGDHQLALQQFAGEFTGEPPRFGQRFDAAQFMRLHPYAFNIGVLDLQGNPVFSHLPDPPPAQEARGMPWVAQALASETFAVSGVHAIRQGGRWVAVLTQPVRDAAGRRTGFAYLALDLTVLSGRLMQSVPPQAMATVLDAEFRFLMRSEDAESLIGKTLDPALAHLYGTEPEGRMRAADISAQPRLWSFVSVPGTGWRVTAGVQEDVALRDYRASRNRGLAVGALLFALLCAGAWLIGAAITGPVRALAGFAARVARGDEQARAATHGPTEVAEVATQLNAMLDHLARAREEREALRSHYETLHRNARDIILLFDASGRIVDANAAALAAYGRSAEELLGLNVADLRAPEAQAALAADWQASASPRGVLFEAVHVRKDGTRFPVEVSARNIRIEGRDYRQSFVRDITERKQVEAAQQARLDELRRWHAAMLGREMRVVELKREVNALLVRAGQPPRYAEHSAADSTDAAGGTPRPAEPPP